MTENAAPAEEFQVSEVPIIGTGMTPELARKDLGEKLAYMHRQTGDSDSLYLLPEMQIMPAAVATQYGLQRQQLDRNETKGDAPAYAAITAVRYRTTDPDMLRQENRRRFADCINSRGTAEPAEILTKVVPGSAGPVRGIAKQFLAFPSDTEVAAAEKTAEQPYWALLTGSGDSPAAAEWALGTTIGRLERNPELGSVLWGGQPPANAITQGVFHDGREFVGAYLVSIVAPNAITAHRIARELSTLAPKDRTFANAAVAAATQRQASTPDRGAELG